MESRMAVDWAAKKVAWWACESVALRAALRVARRELTVVDSTAAPMGGSKVAQLVARSGVRLVVRKVSMLDAKSVAKKVDP